MNLQCYIEVQDATIKWQLAHREPPNRRMARTIAGSVMPAPGWAMRDTTSGATARVACPRTLHLGGSTRISIRI